MGLNDITIYNETPKNYAREAKKKGIKFDIIFDDHIHSKRAVLEKTLITHMQEAILSKENALPVLQGKILTPEVETEISQNKQELESLHRLIQLTKTNFFEAKQLRENQTKTLSNKNENN